MKLIRSASGRRTRATPVRTECVRPESFSSMWRASSVERGLPKMWPSSATSVSAATMMAGPTERAATSSALALARRKTRSWADSPGYGVSSMAEETTAKRNPAASRISARRGEAEASTSFMGSRREEYYSESALTACAVVQWEGPGGQARLFDSTSGPSSDDNGFLIFAEEAAEGIG